MRWQGREGSKNVKDYRNVKRTTAGVGIGGILFVIIGLLLGENPLRLISEIGSQPGAPTEAPTEAPTDELGQFVSVVLKDTEDAWNYIFREQLNRNYVEPELIIFNNQIQSACGFASAATGPFYCPADQQVYIDLSFYNELRNRFRAPGELHSRFAPVLGAGDTAADPEAAAIVYCGSGVTACHNALAIEHAGLARPRVYVGSWSGWSSEPDRPIATGAAP